VACSSAAQVERETSLCYFSAQQRVACFQLEKVRRQIAMRDQLHEKLECVFVRRGNDGIRSFESLSVLLDSKRGILPGAELERPAWVNSNDPEILRKIPALENARLIVLVWGRSHFFFNYVIQRLENATGRGQRRLRPDFKLEITNLQARRAILRPAHLGKRARNYRHAGTLNGADYS
jgi:hypothetical protein